MWWHVYPWWCRPSLSAGYRKFGSEMGVLVWTCRSLGEFSSSWIQLPNCREQGGISVACPLSDVKPCQAPFWTQLFVVICGDKKFKYVWNTQGMDDGWWRFPGWLFSQFSHGHDMRSACWRDLWIFVNACSSHFGVELGLIQLSRDIQQRRCGILHVFGIGTSAIADWTLPSASWSDRQYVLQLHVWNTAVFCKCWIIWISVQIWRVKRLFQTSWIEHH